jgi:hypothetical protein
MHVHCLGKASKREQRTGKPFEHVCKYEIKHLDSIQISGCTRWLRWVRHWVKNLKFAGSIPCRDIGIFHYLNPSSGRSMDLGSNEL